MSDINNPGVTKLGEIQNVGIYSDEYCEENKVYVGRKGVEYPDERKSKVQNLFIVGKSNVLESYEKVVYRYVNKRVKLKNIKCQKTKKS
jgi:hypothetical protein